MSLKDALMIQNIKEYSTKFYNIYQKIKQSTGPIFVYLTQDIGYKIIGYIFEYQLQKL